MISLGCSCASHHCLEAGDWCPYTRVQTQKEFLNVAGYGPEKEEKVKIKPEDAEAAVAAGTHRWVEKSTDDKYTVGAINKNIAVALDEDSAELALTYELEPVYTDPELRYGDVVREVRGSGTSTIYSTGPYGDTWQYLPNNEYDINPFRASGMRSPIWFSRSELPEKIWVAQRLSDCTPPGPKDSNNRPIMTQTPVRNVRVTFTDYNGVEFDEVVTDLKVTFEDDDTGDYRNVHLGTTPARW